MLCKGQTVLEYLLLISVITMALMFMSTDFKRGVQSVLKVTADQLGQQSNADQDYDRSYLLNTTSRAAQQHQQTIQEQNRVITKIVEDAAVTTTQSVTNQGVSE